MKKILIYSDGGARGNPGPAGIGGVLYDANGKLLFEISEYIGETTNNQAEYRAFISALEEANNLEATEIVCHLDSELIVKQINGEYKIKNENLKPLFLSAKKLLSQFDKYIVLHIPRNKNKHADKLVNIAIDEYSV